MFEQEKSCVFYAKDAVFVCVMAFGCAPDVRQIVKIVYLIAVALMVSGFCCENWDICWHRVFLM